MDHSHPTLSEQTLCRASLISVDNMPSSQVLTSSTVEPPLTLLLDPHAISPIALCSQHVQNLSLLTSSTDSAHLSRHHCPIWEQSCLPCLMGLPGGASGKEPACQCRRCKRHGFDPWVRKIPWRQAWQFTPVFLPGESRGQRSLPYTPVAGPSLFYWETTTGSVFHSEWKRKSLRWLISLLIN